ncbi:Small integral membrane protein 14 [Echinococcus granulosus]|nr:Small integral membrane protein 14 [Echinococcus granulosus]
MVTSVMQVQVTCCVFLTTSLLDMSGDFDPCECIYNHETSMQRLLTMLRQSQAYCNDVICQSDLSNPFASQSDSQISSSFFVFFAWILVIASVLAFRTCRQGSASGSDKPGPAGNNDPEPPTIY